MRILPIWGIPLTLKETAAPDGYELDETEYQIVITSTAREELQNGTYVTITKYEIKVNGETSADITNTKKTDTDREDNEITINKQDQDEKPLDGATFKLYSGETGVASYEGGTFKISTKDDALKEYLPEVGAEKTLTLKETDAPDGYEKDDTEYAVKLTASSEEELKNGVFVTTTSYDIKVNGDTSADITNTKKTDSDREDSEITINKQDQDEKPLDGATFKLYDGETEVASYTGGSFKIKTDDEALADYLPAAGDSKKLTLKETEAPAGYEKDDTEYEVVLTASSEEELKDDVFVTTTTYGITISGETSADITNTKKTDTDREDSGITINKQDQDEKPLDGATFKLYSGETEVATYEGGTFKINTKDDALKEYLPEAGAEKTLTLKETDAPDGYEKDDTEYAVKLTASSEEELKNGVFVTTTTYGITINGETSADITNTKKTDSDRKDSGITINKQDQDEKPLDGATFKLYDGNTEVASYTGGSFKIKTDDEALSDYLPAAGDSKELTLKETEAPAGYEKDDTEYEVVLTASSEEELKDGVFVTTTTYTIKVDGKTSADITNTKKTDSDRKDSGITINKQDQDEKPLDGATFKLYDGKNEIKEYTGGSFTIKTDDDDLKEYLPKAGEEKTLTLKETDAPDGYEKDDTEYAVKLTASSEEELKNGVFVTTTTYGITINGKTSANITNTKKTDTDRKDSEITINKQDQDEKPLDGATFKLYSGETEVATYEGGTFMISTKDDALKEYLPEAGAEKALQSWPESQGGRSGCRRSRHP